MVQLRAGDERFRDDRGEADPAVTAALAAYAAGTGTEQAALTALANARLLVPVVAVRADHIADGQDSGAHARGGHTVSHPDGESVVRQAPGKDTVPAVIGEKAGEMAMPAIVGHDGRRALPAFTSARALQGWQPGARPVPVPAAGVWQSAVQESTAVIIDIAGPVPLAVEGARLAVLASGGLVPPLHEDPDVWQFVAAVAGRIAPGVRVRLSSPQGAVDFTLELAPPEGADGLVSAEVAARIGGAVTDGLAGRIRNGVAVVLYPAGGR